jgi:hypothetical protein
VTLPAGEPLKGVRITATPRLPGFRHYAYDPSVDDSLEEFERWRHFSSGSRVFTQTDAEGAFECTGLGDYEFTVVATVSGYRCTSVAGLRHGGAVRPNAEVHFVASPVCEIELDVRLPDGSAPPEAYVKSSDARQGWDNWTWTPANRRHGHRAGSFVLEVRAGKHREFVSAPVEVELVPGAGVPLVAVQLKSAPGLVCHVNLPTGYGPKEGRFASFRQVQVCLEANPSEQPPPQLLGNRQDGKSLSFENAALFLGLSPGRYRAIAQIGGYTLGWKDVAIADQLVEETLDIAEPDATHYIEIAVVSPDGSAPPMAWLAIRHESRSPGDPGPGFVINRGEGKFWARRWPPEVIDRAGSEWSYTFQAGAKGYAVVSATYPGDGKHALVVRLAPPATLTLEFPGAFRPGFAGKIYVELVQVHPHPSARQVVVPNEPGGMARGESEVGVQTYSPVAPGTYELKASARSPGQNGGEVARWSFELPEGDQKRSFPIPPLYKLTVLRGGSDLPAQLELRNAGLHIYRSAGSKDASGRFVVDFLPPGEWVVASIDHAMRVAISGDTEIRFEPRAFDCLELRGPRDGGPLYTMGLRTGDLLIAVDGQEWDTLWKLRRQAEASHGLERTVWTVLRDGTRVELPLNGTHIADAISPQNKARDSLFMNPALPD